MKEKSRSKKRKNLENGIELLDVLVAHDFSVVQFSPFHFRVNDRLDVWPSTKKWFDRNTQRKETYNNLIEIARDICKQ